MSNNISGFDFDKEVLLALYEQVHNNRRDYVERMWGTVQYFTTVVTSLLTLSIGGAFVILQYGGNIPMFASIAVRLSLSLLCLMAVGLSVVGLANLKRECQNEYVQMGILLTIERLLGLQNEIPPDKRFFAQQLHLIPYYLFLPKESFPNAEPSKILVSTMDEFVDRMMTKKRSFYAFFRRVFQGFIILSLGLSALFAVWAFIA